MEVNKLESEKEQIKQRTMMNYVQVIDDNPTDAKNYIVNPSDIGVNLSSVESLNNAILDDKGNPLYSYSLSVTKDIETEENDEEYEDKEFPNEHPDGGIPKEYPEEEQHPAYGPYIEKPNQGYSVDKCNKIPLTQEEQYRKLYTSEENVISNDFYKDAETAVLSLSGGMDSTCLLMKMLADGKKVNSFSFYYGQKHKIELTKVKRNIKFLQQKGFPVTHQIIDLKDVFSDSASSLHQGGEEIPEGNYADENMKSTVVENRNVIFSAIIYGKALGLANKTGKNIVISEGVHDGDHAIYPDCRAESIAAARNLYAISNWNSEAVDFIAPFNNLSKGEVLEQGINAMKELGFKYTEIKKVLKNTHTCYNPDDNGVSCGKCGSCTERIEAFKYNKMVDPIPYTINIDWTGCKYAK